MGSAFPTEQATAAAPILDFLHRSVGSRNRQPFRGVRRVTQFELDSDGIAAALEIREEVGSDGTGDYSIELVEVISLPAGMDRSLYPITHARSADVFWSKRDFDIQDIDLASLNYSITHLPDTALVAGVVCEQVEFVRYMTLGDRPGRYVVQFDPATGFVLGWTEFDRFGAVLVKSVYESFSYRASLDGLALRGASFSGNALSLARSLNGQSGFPVLLPDLLPSGFEIYEVKSFVVPVEMVQTGDSYLPPGPWARMHATDGIESLSFAHGQVMSGHSGIGDDQLRVLRQGSWVYGFGRASGVPFVVAGRVTTTALRQLVESAIR